MMNKGRLLREFNTVNVMTEVLPACKSLGWNDYDHCADNNALGILVLFRRGIERAGLVHYGNGYALVEVIL